MPINVLFWEAEQRHIGSSGVAVHSSSRGSNLITGWIFPQMGRGHYPSRIFNLLSGPRSLEPWAYTAAVSGLQSTNRNKHSLILEWNGGKRETCSGSGWSRDEQLTYQGVQGSFIVRRWWGLPSISRPNSCACWYEQRNYNATDILSKTISPTRSAVLLETAMLVSTWTVRWTSHPKILPLKTS